MGNYATVQSAPTAYITKGKQRIKQNGDTVYLQNGDTFEIELYNPTQNDVLAKIELNNKPISGGGIVLRPGERVFLERYLDDAKKFKFDVYEVDDSFQNEIATQNNGWVSITFHREKQYQPPVSWSNTPPYFTYYNNTGTGGYVGTTTTGGVTFNTTGMSNMSVNASYSRGMMETGKIEKGGKSKQKFQNVNKEFEVWAFETVNWKILPKSRQPLTAKEVNTRYCTECGAKMKKATFKFCPHCGNKLD